jgi:hypothetical protein
VLVGGDARPVTARAIGVRGDTMAVRSSWASRSGAWARGILVVAIFLLHTGIAVRAHVIQATEPMDVMSSNDGLSLFASREQRDDAVSALPLNRLTPEARQRIERIVQSPTIYRRMPTQAIDCDRDMFLFLTRNPEVLVGMWDLMDVTKVTSRRTGPFQLEAEDGSGTKCKVDLVYGDSTTHVFVADGAYDGRMVAKPIHGQGVFLFRSSYAKSASGGTTVTGTLDCFVQFDNLGADLVARTLSGVIGRSADNNFVETARFISQVSQASARNPSAMVDVAERIPQVSPATRKQFVDTIVTVSRRALNSPKTAAVEVPGEKSR